MPEVINLQVRYGPLLALHSVDMMIRPGEMVALVGPNGAGKSTLLKTISGLLTPRDGVVRWRDETISGVSPQRIVEYGIALVPEGRRLFAAMSVRENLELGAFTARAQKKNSRRWIASSLSFRVFSSASGKPVGSPASSKLR